MLLPSHLRVTRHGVFQFRLVLPDTLAHALGQREFRRSLGTKRAEGAKLSAYALSARMLPLVRSLDRAMSIDPNSIDPKTVRQLIAENLVIENGVIKATRLETSKDPEVARRELQALGDLAKATLLPAEGAAYERAVQEREIMLAALTPPPVTVARPKTIDEAIAGFLRFKKHAAAGTVDMYGRRLRVFSALAGGGQRMLHLLTESECAEIVEALNVLPANANERDVKPAAEMLAAPPSRRAVGAGTIGDHLVLFGAFFAWAIRSKHHPGPNPFRDVAKPKGGTASGGAVPFTNSELERIFAPETLAEMNRPHRFWGPLLGLFTGARSNEIAQLRLVDFVDESGLKCIRIVHDSAGGTRTKNADSERILPLHPTLLEIGLGDYLEDLRELGAERLFPNLPRDTHGKREKYLSRDFNEIHLKDLGIWQPRRKVFHSFRDTVTNVLAEAEVKDFYIEAWLGHSVRGVTGQHYRQKPSPDKLAKACLPALGFDFLNLASVRYERGAWNDWMARNLKP